MSDKVGPNSGSKPLSEVVESLLSLVFPAVCALCSLEVAGKSEGYVCKRCSNSVRRVRPPFCGRCGLPPSGEITTSYTCANCRESEPCFESARAAVIAEGRVLEVIHRFKYWGEVWFEPFLVQLLLEEACPILQGSFWSGLVPVPLHPVRERERGFNQATRLATPLARALEIPIRTDLVRRNEMAQVQAHLSREARVDNVRQAFSAASQERIQGDWIVFDDVLTTGATAGAVAAVLQRMGAERVVVWSLARATMDGSSLGSGP